MEQKTLKRMRKKIFVSSLTILFILRLRFLREKFNTKVPFGRYGQTDEKIFRKTNKIALKARKQNWISNFCFTINLLELSQNSYNSKFMKETFAHREPIDLGKTLLDRENKNQRKRLIVLKNFVLKSIIQILNVYLKSSIWMLTRV